MMRWMRRLSATGENHGDVLLHCHIFKNAGTTIDVALERSFGSAFFDHREDIKLRREGMEGVEDFLDANPRIFALSSHHMPFDPNYMSPRGRRFWRIFMVREPIDRAGSVHAFEVKQGADVKQGAGSRGATVAKGKDVRGYFEWRLSDESPAVVRNFHVRNLSGFGGNRTGIRQRRKPVDVAASQLAFAQIEEPATCFGIVERFDESMVIMESRLKEVFPRLNLAHVVANKNRGGTTEERREVLHRLLGDELFERLVKANEFDTELYRRVNDALDSEIRNTPDFDARLQNYRRRCAALGK